MLFWNSAEKKAQKEADRIRQDLYGRVTVVKKRLLPLFKVIDLAKKEKVLLSSATQLASMMDSQEVTSTQVMLIFIERTINVGLQHNYVLDEMFEQALTKATQCDQLRRKHQTKKCWKVEQSQADCFPPFFGVPVSIKETILIKGRQSYGGFVSRLNPIPEEDPALVELIKNMGLIPFVRTNVCQACKSIQTNNNMFGYTKNVRNPERSCGGSSGGEGGLVGAHCSPIGIGSDIGGSLRIPAEFNGLFTLKPSGRSDRKVNAYYGRYTGGCPFVGEPGALTHSTEDLVTYSAFTFDPAKYQELKQSKVDPQLVLSPFNYSIFERKPSLKIGVVSQLKNLKCSKSHERVLEEVSEILKTLGHTVEPMELPGFQKLYFFMVKMLASSPNLKVIDQIRQGQALIKEYRLLYLMSKIPWIIKRIIIYVSTFSIQLIKKRQPRLAQMISHTKELTANELVEEIYEAQTVQAKAVHKNFTSNKVDLVMMPGFAVPAPKLGEVAGLQYCLSFNSGWNTIHYPVGAMPVSLVQEGETTFEDQFEDIYTKNMRKAVKGSEGLPIGIQLAALPRNQETILYMMHELEKQLKFNEKHGLTIRF